MAVQQGPASVEVGEGYPMGIVVRDDVGEPINAQTVSLTITRPDLTIDMPQIGNPPGIAGHYQYDYTPLQAGRHTYFWHTTTPTLTLSGSFNVIAPGSAGIVSLARAKSYMRLDEDDTKYDDELRSLIRGVTHACEAETKETIVRTMKVQTFRLRRPRSRVVIVARPVIAVTAIERIPSGVTVDAGGLVDVDENGIVTSLGAPFAGDFRLHIAAGYAAIPDEYEEAALMIIQHMWTPRAGNVARPKAGGQTEGQQSATTYSIPNRARDLLHRAGPLVG